MRYLGRLYLMELKSNYLLLLGFPLAMATVGLIIMYREFSMSNELAVTSALSMIMVGGGLIVPAVMTIFSNRLIKRDWTDKTIYQLMSFPIRGYTVIGAKLLAMLSFLTVGVVSYATLIYIFLNFRVSGLSKTILDLLLSFLGNEGAFKVGAFLVSMAIYSITAMMMASILSTLFRKGSSVVVFLIYGGTIYALDKIITAVAKGYSFDIMMLSLLNTIISLVYFVVASIIYEKRAEA